jgi:propanediol dehydratase small subunit
VREKVVPDDTHSQDAEHWRVRAEQARAIAHKRKDATKLILMALADNFERLAELAKTKETTSTGCAQPNTD